MKIKLMFNRPTWAYKKRTKALETYLSSRVASMYGKLTIETEEVNLNLVMDGDKISEKWFNSQFKGQYDSFGLIVDPKDWKGKESLRGHYVDGAQKLSFYVIADGSSTVKRKDGNTYPVFEDTLEHEIIHACFQDTGAKKKPSIMENIWMPGYDNTHHYWNKKHDVEGAWDEIYDRWKAWSDKQQDRLNSAGLELDEIEARKKWKLTPRAAERWALLKHHCALQDIHIKLTSGYRSNAEQALLYAQGRTLPGSIVTNAKPGESKHNYGVAFDIYPIQAGWDVTHPHWTKIGDIGVGLGLEWGGDWKNFKDYPHFELND